MIASPWSELPARSILKPLNSGGLCDPVTWIPPSVPSDATAKYSAGVGSSPTSITVAPPSTSPRLRAAANPPPEGRLSRPTATVGPRPSTDQAVLA